MRRRRQSDYHTHRAGPGRVSVARGIGCQHEQWAGDLYKQQDGGYRAVRESSHEARDFLTRKAAIAWLLGGKEEYQ